MYWKKFPVQEIPKAPAFELRKDFSLEEITGPRLVLSIGRNRLYQQIQPDLPLKTIRGKNQGYIIKSGRIGNSQIVFLVGQTPVASYYAAATAVQLLENISSVYHDAAIIDYPDFLSRAWVAAGIGKLKGGSKKAI